MKIHIEKNYKESSEQAVNYFKNLVDEKKNLKKLEILLKVLLQNYCLFQF